MSTEKWNKSLLFEDLKRLDKWLFSKNTFITIFSIGALILLKPFLEHITNEYLVTKKSSSSTITDMFVIFIGGFMFLYGIYKFRLKYQPSLNHILIIFLGILAYSLFRFGNHTFTYDKFKWAWLSKIYYLDFILFTSSVFPFINLFCTQIKSLKKYNRNKPTSTNTYFEDQPINQNQQNEHLITEISDVISSNHFMGSFSIGIMGTWGHGKSSFIQALKSKLKSTPEANGIIEINFSPFLNHKEEDVISDFFKSFSNQLSPYSGQLSQSLLEYAGSITKFYKRGEVTDLLSNLSITSGSPAFELYNNVNDLIGKTERKIVVYIDDLDRLSSKEILQVFKLIRNTSNFRNTFFILALDKTYVVNALAADKSFMESNFVDKFFQLEVFLPEINEAELATYFFDLLIKSKRITEEQISIISQPIRNKNTLFGDYIQNYRDCIRLANQIMFDLSVLKNLITEVSVKDTLNLIFLRTRFPQIFNELHQNRKSFLVARDQKYFLRSKTKNDGQQDVSLIEGYLNLDNEDSHDFSKYKIDDIIKANKADYNINSHERNLIFKTLVALFDNYYAGADSIMYWRNFNKLMRLRHDRTDLSNDDFLNWFSVISQPDKASKSTNELLDHGKGDQLVNKISSHQISSKEDFLRITVGSFQLLSRADQYNLDKNSILEILNSLLKEKGAEYPNFSPSKADRKIIIRENYLENDSVMLDERIRLLLFIQDSNSWGFDEQEISSFALAYFNEYLSSKENKTWNISDYKCFRYYHDLKHISDSEILKTNLIDFLKRIDISVFCAQTMETEPFHWLYFGVSRFILELFEDYGKFKLFLEDHPNKDTPSISEYLKFYDLWSVTNYKKYIKFIFNELDVSNLYKQKSQTNIENGISGIQIIIKFNKESIQKGFSNIRNEDPKISRDIFNYEDEFYVLYNSYDFKSPNEFLNYIFDTIGINMVSIIETKIIKDIDDINLTAKILIDGKEAAKLYSIQHGDMPSMDNNFDN